MAKKLLVVLFVFLKIALHAQAEDCTAPTNIANVINYCSGNGFFTNSGSIPSTYGTPTCWTATATEDVWFQFTAIGTDVLISINGSGNGGTMFQPRLAIYDGVCLGVLNELGCSNGTPGVGTTQLYEGALTPGVNYLIRVASTQANEGSFEVCLNNYTPTSNPGADCGGAAFLCSQNPVSVATLSGGGLNNDEPEPGTCLDVPGVDEGNSSWFYWTCATSGPFTLDITPINSNDDIDFILYQLAGNDPCVGRTPIRCCSSSCLNATGSTGLSTAEFDLNEYPGCQAGYNAYVQSINMVAGMSYAILVNNFSASSGFTITFNSNLPNGATFAGPNPNIVANPLTICSGGNISYNGSTSVNCAGGLQWNFLSGGTPTSAVGAGPHVVTYTNPGNYVAILNGLDNQGCQTIEYLNVVVNPPIQVIIQPYDTICSGANAIIPISGNPAGGLTYTWTCSNNPAITGAFNGSGGVINQVVNNTSNATQSVMYTVTASLGGCTSTDSCQLTINPLIEPQFFPEGPFCLGQIPYPVLPIQSVNVPSIAGTWNTPTINTLLLGPTTYSFTPTPNQCADTSTMVVLISNNGAVSFTADTTIGCSPLNVTFTTADIPGATYTWLSNGSLMGNTPVITEQFTTSGCYDIELQFNLNGCSANALMPDYICVEPNPIAAFSFIPGVFGNPSETISFQNGTVGASTYSWDYGDGSNSNLSDPTHIFNNTYGGYSVTLYAYSNSGCADSVTNPIAYEEGLIYYIPNTFTPDQDEFNQTWKPVFTSGFDPYYYELSIYNRWGEIIWVSNNVDVGWDGTYGISNACQEGVYTWKINFKIKGLDDRRLISGTLHLLR